MLPVPGPISRTVSVDFKAALATMAVTTAGFLRKCCPKEVLGATRLEAPSGLLREEEDASLLEELDDLSLREYGDDAAVGPDRRMRLFLGMVGVVVVVALYFWCSSSKICRRRQVVFQRTNAMRDEWLCGSAGW